MSRFEFFSAFLIIVSIVTLPAHATRHVKLNSVLSLSLQTNIYSNRTVSRIEADAARVNYLNSRLRNALFKSKPGFQTESIQSPLTIVGGGYVANIGVGQPATKSTLIADTGSEIVWLKCSPCEQCSDAIFDPAESSTYKPLSCDAPQCSSTGEEGLTCSATNKCGFQASYGDGSTTSGDFVTETLSFGSESIKNLAIGCAHEVGGNIEGFGGILGLGPDPISLPNQLKSKVFSYCMAASASKPGTLDFNSAAPSDSVSVTIGRNKEKDIYYYVELTGITVGKDKVPVPPEVYQIGSDGTGGVIVDSGTTLTYLDQSVYSSFLEAFQNNAQSLSPSQGNQQGFDACYSFPSGSVEGPAMSFQFSDGQSLELEPVNYFAKVDESSYCLAFQPTNQIVSIIGNIAQKGMRVTYDLGKNKIGFSPNKC